MTSHPRSATGKAAGALITLSIAILGLSSCSGGTGGGSAAVTTTTTAATVVTATVPTTSTTTPPTTVAPTTTTEVPQATIVDEDFEAAEAADEYGQTGGPDFDGPSEPISFDGVDRSDPAAVARAWGCAYRAQPFGESASSWTQRMLQMTTERGGAKVASLRAFDGDVDTQSYHISTVDSGDNLYRVQCAIMIRNNGKLVEEDTIGVVWVKLIQDGNAWLVDDFAHGGIGLGS